MLFPEHKAILKDSRGRYRTQSLFREFQFVTPTLEPIWTLKDEDAIIEGMSRPDKVSLPSLKALYLDIADPTEYEFAMQAFGSWAQWLRIKASKAIQPWMESWSEELELKLRSQGIKGVLEEAATGKNPLAAAKFLANAEWNKTSNGRGRPTKAEIEKQTKIDARLNAEFQDDAERVGLMVVEGGKS